jgi:heme a synthase
MPVQPPDGEHATGIVDLLAVGFGTTVAMWAVGYVGRMPLANVSTLVFAVCMLGCVVLGGLVVGRRTARGVRGGVGLGLIVGLLNLLILGSLLAKPDTGQIVPGWWLWLPGYFLICIVLACLGAAVGTAFRPKRPRATDWLLRFAWTACLATLLLITVGGLVTGFRAGLAVPDWPNTYGSNMFFYPLAKMRHGIFYEHAHRLLGALVGFMALALAVVLSIHRRSLGALILIWIVGSCVLLQGIMGGFRVTDNSEVLAVVHGFFAHVILAGMIGVAVLLSRRPDTESTGEAPPNQTDIVLATLLVPAILTQTLLGALVRQMDVGLMLHITVAMFVAMLAILVGVRMWGLYSRFTVVARFGVALMCIVVLQVILGGIALVFRTPPASASPSATELRTAADALRPTGSALVTTAHQTNAAVLLATATALAFWAWRLRSADCAIEKRNVADTETLTQIASAQPSGGAFDLGI